MHLIYHINKGLGVTPMETPNHLGIVVVMENVRD